MVKVEKHIEFDLSHIKDIDIVINDVAAALVVDIKGGIESGKDVDDSQFSPLNPKYKREKMAAGYPSTILKRTDRMRSSVYQKRDATKGSHIAEVSMAMDRKEVGSYHNEGAENLPQRAWFGVGRRAERKLRRLVDEKIKGLLRA